MISPVVSRPQAGVPPADPFSPSNGAARCQEDDVGGIYIILTLEITSSRIVREVNGARKMNWRCENKEWEINRWGENVLQSVLPQLLLPGRGETGDAAVEGRRRLFNFAGGDRGCSCPAPLKGCYPAGDVKGVLSSQGCHRGVIQTSASAAAAPGASGRAGKGFAGGAPASTVMAWFSFLAFFFFFLFFCLFRFFPSPYGCGCSLISRRVLKV